MKDRSSACYLIDEDYNIVTYNAVCKETYPQLEIGQKCYRCLMNQDEPCQGCPVLKQLHGPRTYFDPIRKIYETVDAVEIMLDASRIGHALILSTTGERESVSRQLPTTERELTQLLNQDYYDKLTGGFSRKGFVNATEEILGVDVTRSYAIILFDVWHFKSVNDLFGLYGGDQLLKDIYQKLSDSAHGAFERSPLVLARLEADHFACLVEQKQIQWSAYNDLLSFEWCYKERKVQVDLYSGIYLINDRIEDVSHMIENAFLAKEFAEEQETREKYAIYGGFMKQRYVGYTSILSSFPKGIEHGDFEVYYQPIIETLTGRTVFAEALVRWNHQEKGFLPPDRFIPILEKNGMITRLDHYVMREVYRHCCDSLMQNILFVPITVNLSWQDFYDKSMMDDALRLAQSELLPRGSLNFEVTETSLSALQQNCSYLLDQLQQCGARILLDDFGTGVSSFGMISQYSFDVIKIDRSFVRKIDTSEKTRNMIQSIIAMCHQLGMSALAEGVETEGQLVFLREAFCDYIQGYYFGKPMPKEAFWQQLQQQQEREKETLSQVFLSSTRQIWQSLHADFFRNILDHVEYFITVINPEDYSLVYMNETSRSIARYSTQPYFGEKCYHYLNGLDQPCAHCPKHRMNESNEQKVIVDDGHYVFAVYVSMQMVGDVPVFVEIGRSVTDEKERKEQYTEQIKSILTALPDGQGVFHVDVTDDRWISSDGNAQNARDMQNMKDVDTLIRQIGSFIPDQNGQDAFFQTFCRKAMLDTYQKGLYHISGDTLSYYDDGRIRWSRVTAHLLINPQNDHLESIIYGVDISGEKTSEETEQAQDSKVLELYAQADQERRVDFLTGLENRLELANILRDADMDMLTAVLMLDMDNFKEINDRYGHQVGDQCLKEVGCALKQYGEAHRILFFRYGGEEVLGLLFYPVEDMRNMANEILDVIRGIRIKDGDQHLISLTASLGYTTIARDYETMVDLADRAMRRAKQLGKNRSFCYEEM